MHVLKACAQVHVVPCEAYDRVWVYAFMLVFGVDVSVKLGVLVFGVIYVRNRVLVMNS